MKLEVFLASGCALAVAQQVYIPVKGPSSRPTCAANNTYTIVLPSYTFRKFSFTQTETVRTSTYRPSPTATKYYAPPYASLSHFVPNLTTTQWGNWQSASNTNATDAGVTYGNAS
jgi:hypothetical protein